MKQPKKIKKYLLIVLLLDLLFFYAPVYAQTDVPDYRQSGVSAQIEKYLCAPKPVAPGETAVLRLSNNQDQAAFRNSNSSVFYDCINRLYKFSIVLASVIGVFFIVIAGYVYIGAGGNQESVDKAKSIITSTIVSLVILFSGYVLLKAINPDIIEFHSIQPPSVKIGDLAGGRTEEEGKTSVAAHRALIKTQGTCGANCVDYTTQGLTGNNTQDSGRNTFLDKNLVAKLKIAKGSYQPLIITEGYPPTVDHSSECHFKGTCADLGTTAARNEQELNKLCDALKGAGVQVLNEYPGIPTRNCGPGQPTPKSTGGHFHVY